MEPPVGYGVMDRSILPESQFGVDAHPSFPNREPPGLESRFRAFPHHEGARSASPVVLTESIGCGQKRVVRASYLVCKRDDLRRQVVYLGEREDKSAVQVRRDSPRCDRNQAPSCAMISVITSHDSYLQAFSGEKP
jgi:hypothetical protein